MSNSPLLKRLIKREQEEWKSTPLSDKLNKIKPNLRQIIDERTIRLPYTPHDFRHVIEVENEADNIISKNEKNKYLDEPFNLYILILSIWFHDSGLVQLSEMETVDEIRKAHHLRIGQFLRQFFSDSFDETEIALIQEIGTNHCQKDSYPLSKEKKYNRVINELQNGSIRVKVYPRLNAVILRLADIFSITNTRTPWCLYRNLELNEESVKHWETHFAINSIEMTISKSNEIDVNIEIQYSSRELLEYIQNNAIKNVENEIALDNKILKGYGLRAFHPKVALTLNEKYIGDQKNFSVLPDGLYDLLTEGLYGSKDVFIRELVQNSFDAITRYKAKSNSCEPDYIEIDVKYENQSTHSKIKSFRIRDFGIGMDQGDIDTYFLQIASKAINNEDLVKAIANAGLDPLIQQWGIGFLSVFAVSKDIIIRTHKEGMRPIKLTFKSHENSIQTKNGITSNIYCDIIEDEESLPIHSRGTEITIQFHEDIGFDILEILQHYIRYPIVKLKYTDNSVQNRSIVINPEFVVPDEGAVKIDNQKIRGGWIKLNEDGYKKGITLIQAGILIEENVTDILKEEGINIFGEIDCRSKFLKLPASRSQAIRTSESWNELHDIIIQLIPDCIDTFIANKEYSINSNLPKVISSTIIAALSSKQDIKSRVLQIISQNFYFSFLNGKKTFIQELTNNQNNKTIYLTSKGSTADGSLYLQGHYRIHSTKLFMSAKLSQSAKESYLEANNELILPIAPESWTLGSDGFLNEDIIRELCKKFEIELDETLLRENEPVNENSYSIFSISDDETLKQIWNKSIWIEGGVKKAICLGHRFEEFLFAINSTTPTVQKLKKIWIEKPESRVKIKLLLSCYCESLRVNPKTVIELIEEYVDSQL